jgi:hypothetical protein
MCHVRYARDMRKLRNICLFGKISQIPKKEMFSTVYMFFFQAAYLCLYFFFFIIIICAALVRVFSFWLLNCVYFLLLQDFRIRNHCCRRRCARTVRKRPFTDLDFKNNNFFILLNYFYFTVLLLLLLLIITLIINSHEIFPLKAIMKALIIALVGFC